MHFKSNLEIICRVFINRVKTRQGCKHSFSPSPPGGCISRDRSRVFSCSYFTLLYFFTVYPLLGLIAVRYLAIGLTHQLQEQDSQCGRRGAGRGGAIQGGRLVLSFPGSSVVPAAPGARSRPTPPHPALCSAELRPVPPPDFKGHLNHRSGRDCPIIDSLTRNTF